MMSLDEEKKSMRDAYWRARDAADAGESDEPKEMRLAEMDFSGDTPKEDVAESPEGVPDFNVPEVPLSSAPMVSAQTPEAARAENQRKRLAALQDAARIASSPLDVPGNDAEIAKAQASDKAQRGRDAITEAIQGWLMRRPAKAPAPQDADDLIKRRQLAEGSAFKQRQQQLSVQEQLIKALTDPNELNDYQRAQMKRWDMQDSRGREQMNAKKLSDETKAAKDEASRQAWLEAIINSGRYGAGLKKLGGGDLAKGIERFKALDQKSGQDLQNAWEQDLNRASNVEVARIARSEKRDDAMSQDIPPGYEVQPGANPGPDSRKKFTALVTSQRKLGELTKEMRGELRGADLSDRFLPGAKKARLKQLATEIRIEAKNVADLGALSGPDMGLMEAIAQDPTTLSSLGSGDLETNLSGLDSWGAASVRAGEQSYGLRRKGGDMPATSGVSSGPASLVTRKTKSGATAYQGRKTGRWFTTPEEAEAN